MKHKLSERDAKKNESTNRLASLFAKLKWGSEVWIGLGVLVGVIAVAGFVFFSILGDGDVGAYGNTPVQQVSQISRHPLTGEVVEEPYEMLPQVFGVMIESAADAWPLSGINDAFLVIEAPVEAGIPRFLAFFTDQDDVAKIGPVRSARPYYVDWNDGLQAIYAHVGGSPAALEQIVNGDTLDVNEFWFGKYFWRDNGTRYAPHNVYTSTDNLIDVMDTFDLEAPSYELWSFEEIEQATDPVKLIEIDFADGALYDIRWEYSVVTQQYERYTDWTGNQMWVEDDGGFETTTTQNVIVMATDIRTIDNIGRKSIKTIGSGNAFVFRNGNVDFVTWRQDSSTDRLRFEKDGVEFPFTPGFTWIAVVSDLSQVEYE